MPSVIGLCVWGQSCDNTCVCSNDLCSVAAFPVSFMVCDYSVLCVCVCVCVCGLVSAGKEVARKTHPLFPLFSRVR